MQERPINGESAADQWERTSQEGKDRNSFIDEAITEILQSTGKYSSENYETIKADIHLRFVLYTLIAALDHDGRMLLKLTLMK